MRKVKIGSVILLGKHRLLCGDSRNPEHIEKLMDEKMADAVITDPPYNVDYKGEEGEAIKNDLLSERRYKDMLFQTFSNSIDYSKRGAAFYSFIGTNAMDLGISSIRDAGWKIRQNLIWAKHHFTLSRSPYHWKHEALIFGAAPGAPSPWYSDRKQTTLLEFPIEVKDRIHPTQKPKELIKYLLKNSTKEGDIILDPFGGSGTTLLSCEAMGRRAFICEIDPKWCMAIMERWSIKIV